MKYIIEIKPEYEDSFKGVMILGAKDSNLFVDTLAVENLEQYTPVDVEKIYDKASADGYNRGLEDGKAQSGLGCDGCKYEGRTSGENPCCRCARNANDYWAAKDDKIEVGDEAETQKGTIFVVTKVTADNLAVGFTNDGSNCIFNVDRVVKTGRHFDIGKILEEMRE